MFEFLFGKKTKQASAPESAVVNAEKVEVKKKPGAPSVVKLDNIIKSEGIGPKELDKDVRYCYDCGATINRNTGYLVQAAIPSYARNMVVTGFSSLVGTSCEHRDGDHALALWYWFCDKCGPKKMDNNYQNIYSEAANNFWKTGQPPKRNPIWQDEL